MPRRPCLDCGRLTTNPSRCDQHAALYAATVNRQRGSSTQRGYGSAWRRMARALVTEYRATVGDHCPGYGVAAHASADLTADHIIPKAVGGTDEVANLRVLCRACNSRKHAR